MPGYHQLSQMVSQRLHQAYVLKTQSMFIVYMMFCEFMQLDSISPTLITILTFIEFLAHNGLKHSSIVNYISAVKAQFKFFSNF